MRRSLYLFAALLGMTMTSGAQDFMKVPGTWIDDMRARKDDTLYIINFWATWCKPCVEELPLFEEITQKYKGRKLKVILVSNDMKKDVDTRLTGFIRSKKITSQVVWMNESNPAVWIDKVSKDFSGAIPATWIIRNSIGFEHFKEGETTREELETFISQTIDLK